MVCYLAAGLTLSPMIVFKKSWPSGPYAKIGPDGGLYCKSPNG